MRTFCIALTAGVVAAALASISPATSSEVTPMPTQTAPNVTGLHDFDFLVGEWQVHHRKLKERLADNHDWIEFDGTLSNRKILGGWGNIDDNVLDLPGDTYRGVGIRAYDPKTARWAIWWLDGRNPFGAMDPPVIGSFENGVGNFYGDDTLRGKPVRVRYTWSRITPRSCHWEQALSPDEGKTWETNWIMDFQRVS
jgi:hypothetical protein